MSRLDGGPAFPMYQWKRSGLLDSEVSMYPGMSLRDWFAGMALQGLLGNPFLTQHNPTGNFVKESYDYADALLAYRDQP